MARLALNFYRLMLALSCASMVAAFITVALGIVARLANWNLPGLDAYAGYAIAAALFLALPSTLIKGEHIRVTLLLERAPQRLRQGLEWWSLAAALALTVYMAWFAVRLVWVSYVTHDVSSAADASPLWIPQVAMALGCLGFAMAFAQALVGRWKGRDLLAAGAASHTE